MKVARLSEGVTDTEVYHIGDIVMVDEHTSCITRRVPNGTIGVIEKGFDIGDPEGEVMINSWDYGLDWVMLKDIHKLSPNELSFYQWKGEIKNDEPLPF